MVDVGAPGAGSVHVLLAGRATRVVLSGEVDVSMKEDLDEAAREVAEIGRPVQIDAQHLTFMDSTAVAFLAKVLARSSQPALVIQPPPVMTFLLRHTGLQELVRVVDDVADLPGWNDEPPSEPA